MVGGYTMHKKSVPSTELKDPEPVYSDIAATLAGIPTGESISRQAFVGGKEKFTPKSRTTRTRAIHASPKAGGDRFIRTHRLRGGGGSPTVTRSYHELTRKLVRRQKMQRLMAATVMVGFVVVFVSVLL